jgi:hypothetical protein
MMSLRNSFLEHLKTTFPGLKNRPELDSLIADNLLSSFKIELPKSVLLEAQRAVATLYGLREKQIYQNFYAADLAALKTADPGNKSIAMSYDFHVSSENRLKLIEVNTNASFLALGYELYRMKGAPLPVSDFSRDEIRKNIQCELALQGRYETESVKISTIDQTPAEQKLYAEFLLYDEYFKSWGWESKIEDYRQVDLTKVDFIYNRYTDFMLNAPESATLKKAFLERSVCISPNPYEYFLLADKQRMIDWSQSDNLQRWQVSESDQQLISSMIPKSMDINGELASEVWAQRKGLFFKPKRAFGSKQSYRGSSISRKAFDEILGHEFIAQEYVPAAERVFETPEGPTAFKYDLRCYAYQGRLQLIVARIYQGQVTNLRTPHGGFACVEFY